MTQKIQSPITHQFVPTNGVNLHVAQAGDPQNELIILLHGFPEFWYGWRHQIDALVNAGFHVWCPDQRGYNLSAKPSGVKPYQLSTLTADIVGLIDAAGRDKVYLVGHDWGAAVAWQVAIHHPDRLKKLAILNVPHPQVTSRALLTDPSQMLKSWYIGFFQLPFLPETLFMGDGNGAAAALFWSSRRGTFTDIDMPAYIAAWKQPGAPTAMINWYRALLRYPPDLEGDQRVRVQTMILWGAQDVALQADLAEKSRQQSDDARLVMFENASHWVQHEEAPRVNELLIEHFASQPNELR